MRCLLFALLALSALPSVAQGSGSGAENQDMVRVTHQPDGSKSIYTRRAGAMICSTYTPSGRLAAIREYVEGKYGQLVACRIYNNKKEVIYKVAYGYDANARLIEERMFSHPDGKLVQRVIYRFDASGARSKPIVISLNKGAPAIDPTMRDDVNAMNRGSAR